ncbi:hypothetical protein DFS34DRAFT_266883 [Phlyctochytrium arcticum]|nr:hypothetical protein DFS34DRAFT_266883 [Phlyctochytrium arcticum]
MSYLMAGSSSSSGTGKRATPSPSRASSSYAGLSPAVFPESTVGNPFIPAAARFSSVSAVPPPPSSTFGHYYPPLSPVQPFEMHAQQADRYLFELNGLVLGLRDEVGLLHKKMDLLLANQQAQVDARGPMTSSAVSHEDDIVMKAVPHEDDIDEQAKGATGSSANNRKIVKSFIKACLPSVYHGSPELLLKFGGGIAGASLLISHLTGSPGASMFNVPRLYAEWAKGFPEAKFLTHEQVKEYAVRIVSFRIGNQRG